MWGRFVRTAMAVRERQDAATEAETRRIMEVQREAQELAQWRREEREKKVCEKTGLRCVCHYAKGRVGISSGACPTYRDFCDIHLGINEKAFFNALSSLK